MQREKPLTPKSRRIKRPAPSTPDRTHSASLESLAVPSARTQSHLAPPMALNQTQSASMEFLGVSRAKAHGHRLTIAPGDFLTPAPGLFGKKRNVLSRQSIMPASHGPSVLETTRRLQPDNKALEMKLLYDKCLQTKMIELMTKKKAKDQEKIIVSQLGMLAKQDDALNEKLCSIKAKEMDLRTFKELQDGLDNHFTKLTTSLEKFNKKPVEVLRQLKCMLASLDTLRCKNIAIPEKPEDMHKIHELFAKCSNILQRINNLIGNRHDAFCTVNGELKEFTRAHDDIKFLAKKAEQTLCCLQVDVLKDAARSLNRNQL